MNKLAMAVIAGLVAILACFVVSGAVISGEDGDGSADQAEITYIDNTDVTGEVAQDAAIVKVGDKYYSSFGTAIQAANTAGIKTIEFVNNAYFQNTAYPATDNKDHPIIYDVSGLTIDLSGKTVKVDKMAMVLKGKEFSLIDGKIVGGARGQNASTGFVTYTVFVGDWAKSEGTTENVTLSNLTIVGGINVYRSTGVVLKDLNVQAKNFYAVWCEDSILTIKSGTYSIGTTEKAVIGAQKLDSYNGSNSMTVESGIFYGPDDKSIVTSDTDGDGYTSVSPTIKGGFFKNGSDTNFSGYCTGQQVISNFTYNSMTGNLVVSSGDEATVQFDGSASFTTTLKDAVRTVQMKESGNKATITLQKDVDMSGTLSFTEAGEYTLDIGAHTLSHKVGGYLITVGGESPPAYPIDTINTSAKLTILGTGKIDATTGTVLRSYGTMIYGSDGQGPTITYSSSDPGHSIFKVEEGSYLTVNGGEFKLGTESGNAVKRVMQSFGTTVINGGTFGGDVEIWAYGNYASTLTINGGAVSKLLINDCYSAQSDKREIEITNPMGRYSKVIGTDGNVTYGISFDAGSGDSEVTLFKAIQVSSTIAVSKKVAISGGSISTSGSFEVTENSDRMLVNVSSTGDLTLKNVTLNANDKCRTVYCNSGKLTVESGTVITGGKISGSYIGGVYMTGASVFTMNGGKVTGNAVSDEYKNDLVRYSADLWIGSQAKGTINGGEVGDAYVNSNSSASPSAGLILNNGEMGNVFVEWDGLDNAAEFIYNGGTVSKLIMATNSDSDNHTTRGITSLTKGASYRMTASATVGKVGYETLSLAVSAAPDKATVTILKSTDCAKVPTGKTLTFTGFSYLKHSTVTDSSRSPTCTSDGWTEGSHCSRCGETFVEQESIPSTGHSWDSGTVTKEATETSEGVKTYKCSNCSTTRTESIPKLTCTHTWDTGTVSQEATCGAAGSKTLKCTKCGETKTESIPATGNHSWNSGTVVKEPTTTESGTTEYRCSVCGQTKTATIEPKKTEVKEEEGVKTTTDTTKVVEKGEDGSETVTETTTVSKEENGKVVEKVETTTSTTQKDGATIVAETTVTEKDGQTEKVETTKSTTQTEDTTTVAESTVKEKNGQLVEKVETTKSTTQTEDSTIVSETKVTEKAGEETEKVETVTSTTQKEGATIVAETKVTEKGQEKTETIAVFIGSDDGTVKTDVSVSDGTTSGIETVISGDVTEDSIAHAIKQADMATEAISDKVSDVSKNISVPSDNVTLSPTSLGALADSGASLTITGDAGSVGIDADVTGTMMSRNEDVTISISEKKDGLTDAQKEKAGTSKVIELSAKSATEDIHELGGKAKVRIDTTGMDFKSPAVYWLKDDGSSERIEAEFGEGYAAIELDHFSLYYVAETAGESENSMVMHVAIAVVVIAILAIAGIVMYKRRTA